MAIDALLSLVVIGNPVAARDGEPREIAAECSRCAHAREVPGNAHIRCVKPDHEMRGIRHGIERGWFMYPLLFDPVWKSKHCSNFEQRDAVSHAISDPVSRAGKAHTR